MLQIYFRLQITKINKPYYILIIKQIFIIFLDKLIKDILYLFKIYFFY